VVKWELLDEVEYLLNQERVDIGLLDANAQELMAGAKELYAAVEARANTTIKQQEDLNTCTITVSQRERVVAEREQEL
jgi:predicted TIM-barrel enzyme